MQGWCLRYENLPGMKWRGKFTGLGNQECWKGFVDLDSIPRVDLARAQKMSSVSVSSLC